MGIATPREHKTAKTFERGPVSHILQGGCTIKEYQRIVVDLYAGGQGSYGSFREGEDRGFENDPETWAWNDYRKRLLKKFAEQAEQLTSNSLYGISKIADEANAAAGRIRTKSSRQRTTLRN